MKITNVPTPDTNGSASPAPSPGSSAFSDILSSVGGSAGSREQEQFAPMPSGKQPTGQADKGGKSDQVRPDQSKDATAGAPLAKQASAPALQQKVEGDGVHEGPGEELEHQKPLTPADELPDSGKSKLSSDASKKPDDMAVQTNFAEVDVSGAEAKPGKAASVKWGRRKGDRSTVADPQQAADEAVQPRSAPALVPSTADKKAAKNETLADPDWAHAAESEPKVAGFNSEPKTNASTLPAVATPALVPAITPGATVAASTNGNASSGQTSLDQTHVSVAAVRAVKTLRALGVLDGGADKKDVKVVEGEVIGLHSDTPDQSNVAGAVEAGDNKVRATPRGGEERLPSPVNLGKPVLAMATQEMLQESVANRHDAVAATPFGVANLQTAGSSPAPATISQGVPLAQQPSTFQHVVLATSDKKLVPDLGAQIVRSADAGKNEVAIRLDPANLGRIDIHMSFGDDGRMRAVIAADSPATYDMLKRDANVLAQTLSNAGVKTDAGDLRFDMRQGGQQSDRYQSTAYASASDSDKGSEAGVSDESIATRLTRGRLV